MNTKNTQILELLKSITTNSSNLSLEAQYLLRIQLCTAFAEAEIRAHGLHSLDQSITQFKFNRKFNFSSNKVLNGFETEYTIVCTKRVDPSRNAWDIELKKNNQVLMDYIYQDISDS